MIRQAAVTQTCALKSGFAAEGMLCNEPPIPLRVLDFLGTYELVNLSLVCKAMHQAGHVLLQREVRGSLLRLCNLNPCFFQTHRFRSSLSGLLLVACVGLWVSWVSTCLGIHMLPRD
jgi:hypothetical protein